MAIDATTVARIAALAHLELNPEAIESLRHDLCAILDYVATLDTLAVEDVPPTAHPLEPRRPLRPDDPTPCLPWDQALLNASEAAGGLFRVPRVLAE